MKSINQSVICITAQLVEVSISSAAQVLVFWGGEGRLMPDNQARQWASLSKNAIAQPVHLSPNALGVLFYCIYPTRRHTRCLQTALEYRADVNNVSSQGTHVFQLMCQHAKDCAPMCHMMLAKGADPNATDQVQICHIFRVLTFNC